DAKGKACLASGSCGCSVTTDCAKGKACDVAAKTCTSACSATQPCNGGCCKAGTCVYGGDPKSCGDDGLACNDCATSPSGNSCTFIAATSGYRCGCSVPSQCPKGK